MAMILNTFFYICRQRNNGCWSADSSDLLVSADFLTCGKTVHLLHLAIHQNQVEVITVAVR